jgi:broad specificity phosphatase PhoE
MKRALAAGDRCKPLAPSRRSRAIMWRSRHEDTMPARLTLICHAATAATRGAAFPADEGIEPGAAELAARLRRADRPWTRAWTSPALCARQTAAALGLEATVHSGLRDCGYGRWSGRKLADVQAEDPDGVAAWLADAAATPHGGEARSALLARVAAWLRERVAESGRIVAVTHPAVIRAAVMAVLDVPAAAFWRIDVEPLSVTELRSDGTRWTLRAAGPSAT